MSRSTDAHDPHSPGLDRPELPLEPRRIGAVEQDHQVVGATNVLMPAGPASQPMRQALEGVLRVPEDTGETPLMSSQNLALPLHLLAPRRLTRRAAVRVDTFEPAPPAAECADAAIGSKISARASLTSACSSYIRSVAVHSSITMKNAILDTMMIAVNELSPD